MIEKETFTKDFRLYNLRKQNEGSSPVYITKNCKLCNTHVTEQPTFKFCVIHCISGTKYK